MREKEKETIEDCKELVQELKQHKDKDFIGRLYYKNKPVEDILSVLLNLIENQQKEIEHWKAGMKIVQRDKNNHIERLEKELEELKDNNVLIKRYFNKCDLIKHLDNVINKMSEYMDDNIHYNRKTSCLKCGKKYRTQETIRKYFEKKAEESE